MKHPIGEEEVMNNIRSSIEEQDGETVARIHNQIHAEKIKYIGDSLWKYTGEKD